MKSAVNWKIPVIPPKISVFVLSQFIQASDLYIKLWLVGKLAFDS